MSRWAGQCDVLRSPMRTKCFVLSKLECPKPLRTWLSAHLTCALHALGNERSLVNRNRLEIAHLHQLGVPDEESSEWS